MQDEGTAEIYTGPVTAQTEDLSVTTAVMQHMSPHLIKTPIYELKFISSSGIRRRQIQHHLRSRIID